MLTIAAPVPFVPMASKGDTPEQLNVRIRKAVKDALINFAAAHPLQPAIASVVERALVEYLEREGIKVPPLKPRR